MSSQRRILMCPPDYYGIEYEINPWMSRSRGPAIAAVAISNGSPWLYLPAALGVQVELMTPSYWLA